MAPGRWKRIVVRCVVIIFIVGSKEATVHDGVAKQGMLVTG
jgi:hypothetical protein